MIQTSLTKNHNQWYTLSSIIIGKRVGQYDVVRAVFLGIAIISTSFNAAPPLIMRDTTKVA